MLHTSDIKFRNTMQMAAIVPQWKHKIYTVELTCQKKCVFSDCDFRTLSALVESWSNICKCLSIITCHNRAQFLMVLITDFRRPTLLVFLFPKLSHSINFLITLDTVELLNPMYLAIVCCLIPCRINPQMSYFWSTPNFLLFSTMPLNSVIFWSINYRFDL